MTNKQVIAEIDKAIAEFEKVIPSAQRAMLDSIIEQLSDLQLKSGKIQNTVKNIRLISKIKSQLMDLILNEDYKTAVKDFIASFDTVTTMQNAYFRSVEQKFKPPALAAEIKKQSVSAVVDNLTERGIDANVVAGVENILKTATTTGGSIADLHEQLRNYITTNDTGAGALDRYTKQITTDSLSQQAAQYNQIVAADLGYEWFRYQGSLIETSRPFCIACRDKDYIHVSEFADLLAGNFPEFEKADGEINPKTDLPNGLYPDTVPSNFPIYRGGYNCRHQLTPVLTDTVPKNIRDRISKG